MRAPKDMTMSELVCSIGFVDTDLAREKYRTELDARWSALVASTENAQRHIDVILERIEALEAAKVKQKPLDDPKAFFADPSVQAALDAQRKPITPPPEPAPEIPRRICDCLGTIIDGRCNRIACGKQYPPPEPAKEEGWTTCPTCGKEK